MDWKRAKDFTILLLILLNVALMVLVQYKQQQYTLNDKQQQDIIEILKKNQITLQAPILKKFSPMSTLILSYYEWDIEQVKEIFWGVGTETRMTIESEQSSNDSTRKIILMSGNETISMQNNNLIYQNDVGDIQQIQEYNEESVIEYANKYMEKLKPWFTQFVLNSIQKEKEEYILTYYQLFNKKPLFDNKVKMTITPNGLTKLNMTYLRPEQFLGAKKDICAPDEALFTLLQQLKNRDEESIITKIDLGYAMEGDDIFQNEVKVIPYYKITINETVYKINAYTNKISKWERFDASSNRYYTASH